MGFGVVEVHHAEQDQHHPHRQLEHQGEPRRNRPTQQDDARADSENRERVANAPERADGRGAAPVPMAGDDRRDGDDVIRIGGVPHAEEETEENDGQQICHGCSKAGTRRPPTSVKPYSCARSPTRYTRPDFSITFGSAMRAATARPTYRGDSVPLRAGTSRQCSSSVRYAARMNPVRIHPGETATAATPCGFRSFAIPNESRVIAALAR